MEHIDKIPVFDWFYELGDVYITIMTNGSALLNIPHQYKEKEMETFIVGQSPTPNLTYDEYGIKAPMRFGNMFFKCFFPWENIVMLAGEKAVIHFVVEEKSDNDKTCSHINKNQKNVSTETEVKSIKRSHLQVVK